MKTNVCCTRQGSAHSVWLRYRAIGKNNITVKANNVYYNHGFQFARLNGSQSSSLASVDGLGSERTSTVRLVIPFAARDKMLWSSGAREILPEESNHLSQRSSPVLDRGSTVGQRVSPFVTSVLVNRHASCLAARPLTMNLAYQRK